MKITRLPAENAYELWDIFCVVHDLHVTEHLTAEGYTYMSVTYATFHEASAGPMRPVGLMPKITYAEGEI